MVLKKMRNIYKFNFWVTILLTICLLTSSCVGGKHKLPTSIGQPYEVLLEGDTDSVLTQILKKDIPALPQPEPMFDIIQLKKGQNSSLYQTMRNRVVVDVSQQNKAYEVLVARDVNASPQVLVKIKAQSVEQLKARLDGEKLRQLLNQSELQHLALLVKQNVEMQQKVKQQFGVDMKVPFDMDACKSGKDFLWISNNANSGMKNLLILRAKNDREIEQMLRKNMVGETDSMYMVVSSGEERGLWYMKGDCMGGPFVKKCTGDVVVIGFVYAPEMKKRNLIKQLEAVLTTIK